MSMQPKISIVVPSYNQAEYLEDALLSVLRQTYRHFELIVIDGGSTDESVSIIQRYQDQIAYWVSEPDGGQTPALIKGFERATGDIYCWLNSDDLLERGALAEVVAYFAAHPDVDAVYGDTTWIDERGIPFKQQREIPFNRFIWLNTYDYIPGMSMFWRREIYQAVGGLNPEFDLAMDSDLWIRFAEVGRIGHVRRDWSRMRFYPAQKVQRFQERCRLEERRIRERYQRFLPAALERLRRLTAKSVRVLWKLTTGCYASAY